MTGDEREQREGDVKSLLAYWRQFSTVETEGAVCKTCGQHYQRMMAYGEIANRLLEKEMPLTYECWYCWRQAVLVETGIDLPL